MTCESLLVENWRRGWYLRMERICGVYGNWNNERFDYEQYKNHILKFNRIFSAIFVNKQISIFDTVSQIKHIKILKLTDKLWRRKLIFKKALIVSYFRTDRPILATERSFGDTKVFGGHFQVINSAVGPWLTKIGFGAGILLHKVAKVSLSILRRHTPQPLD